MELILSIVPAELCLPAIPAGAPGIRVKKAILDPSAQPSHQMNTDWLQLMPCEAEEWSHPVLPKYLTHKIVKYNEMVVLSH